MIEEFYLPKFPKHPILPPARYFQKKKGEAPKCKTCVRFWNCTKGHGTMSMACERYERKKKRK